MLAPDFVEEREEIMIEDYEAGQIIDVPMHDGSIVRLKKTDRDYDPRQRVQAIQLLEEARMDNLLLTGLLYYEEPRMTLAESENLSERPLTQLPDDMLRPPREALDSLMQSMM